ncbi:hypothetical protein Q5752_005968 [Cryptotrichosporon argae]
MDEDDFEHLGDGVHDLDEVEASASHAVALPSENELRLARRVLELETDNDTLRAELAQFHARHPAHALLVPAPAGDADPGAPIAIPSELLPTLAVLKQHIADLTRDNDALRWTFLGPPQAIPSTSSSSSRPTLDTPAVPAPPAPELSPLTATHGAGSPVTLLSPGAASIPLFEPSPAALTPGLPPAASGEPADGASRADLEAVVERVKVLLSENEELGEMVLEAGRGGSTEWARALNESREVITSLDTDLSHHLELIEKQRAELAAYSARFGPPRDLLPVRDGKAERPLNARDERRDVGGGPRPRPSNGPPSQRRDERRPPPRGDRPNERRDRDSRDGRDARRDERRDDRAPDGPPRGPGGGGGQASGRAGSAGSSVRTIDDRSNKRRR